MDALIIYVMIQHKSNSYPCLSSKMLRNFCHYLSDPK